MKRPPTFLYAFSVSLGFVAFGICPGNASGQGQAESLAASFRKAAERVAPSVVAIRLPGFVQPLSMAPIRPMNGTTRFAFRPGEGDREPVASGVVIDAQHGYILTNDHILQGASQAVVVFGDGKERTTSQIRRDGTVDLAVLVVDPSGLNLVEAKWAAPATLQPGDWVLAIGRPGGGTAPSLSSGIYSARRRGYSGLTPTDDWLETDAAVNVLNSGGPLVNLGGEVVGINTALPDRRGTLSGMGFAIPAERARRVSADLIAFGQVRRAFLGVQIEPSLTSGPERAPGSVVIASVTPASPAEEAGLRPGDIVVSAGGRRVEGVGMIQELIESAPIGEDLTLTVERAGRRQEIVVRPRARSTAVLPVGPGPRILPDARRDSPRTRPRARVGAPATPPLPSPSAGEDAPNALEPIPSSPRPAADPSLDQPKNQPGDSPK
jgi:S1-C subfamily serine protease